MDRKISLSLVISAIIALAFISQVTAQSPEPQSAQVALGTAFTYQGQLKRGDSPANTTCNFQFSLWDAATAGAQKGTTQTANAVSVSNGLFTTPIDFGGQFTGDARWLQTAVQCAGDASYTTLSPRQVMNAVPHANFAPRANTLGAPDGSPLDAVYVNNVGDVGIGTNNPQIKFHVVGNKIRLENAGKILDLRADGAAIDVQSITDDIHINAGPGRGIYLNPVGGTGNVGIGTNNPQTKLDVNGTARSRIVQITGGSDITENFSQADGKLVEVGTVMIVEEQNVGKLKISDAAYDGKVVGVISGAGGVKTGLSLQQEGVMDGNLPVAIAGRVYVKADARTTPIKPGDLLTTSDLAGHAMKATDRERSYGAIIGKALTALDSGTGLVLMLVNLQ